MLKLSPCARWRFLKLAAILDIFGLSLRHNQINPTPYINDRVHLTVWVSWPEGTSWTCWSAKVGSDSNCGCTCCKPGGTWSVISSSCVPCMFCEFASSCLFSFDSCWSWPCVASCREEKTSFESFTNDANGWQETDKIKLFDWFSTWRKIRLPLSSDVVHIQLLHKSNYRPPRKDDWVFQVV